MVKQGSNSIKCVLENLRAAAGQVVVVGRGKAEGFAAGRPMRSESRNPRQGLIRAQVKAGEMGLKRRTWIGGSYMHSRISPVVPAPSLPLAMSRERITGPSVGRGRHGVAR